MKSRPKFLGVCIRGFMALASVVMGAPPNPHLLDDMLRKINKQNDQAVIRNEQGKVVSVRVGGSSGGEFLAESNLSLLTNLDSLTTVKLQFSRGHPLTPEAVASLSALPRLTNLVLMCFADQLEPGVFTQVCKIKHLKRLFLWGAAPPREEFSAVTNLQNLTCFGADVCSTFGKRELSLVATLPRLNSLVVAATKVSEDETNILKSCLTLTNVIFRGPIKEGN